VEDSGELMIKLDKFIIEVIDKAMAETFGSFLGITPEIKKFSVTDAAVNSKFDISGAVVFLQGQIEATLYLRVSKETLFKLLGPLYGKEISEVNASVVGGMGEITNAIYGLAKVDLNQNGNEYEMALPIVIIGQSHSTMMELSDVRLLIEDNLAGEDAVVELILGKTNSSIQQKAS
jgi:CheY-specific phosphatase CheX